MITLYPYENSIQYKEKEEIKEINFSKKAMQYGKIKNIPIFENELKKEAQKRKWVTLFQTKKVHLILPNDYNEKEKEVFLVILENIGLRHIRCSKMNQYLEFKKNKIFLEVHKTYLIKTYYTKKKIVSEFFPYYLCSDAQSTIQHILNQHSIKHRYYLFGSNQNIPNMVKKLNNPNILYYQNCKNYILSVSSP